MCCAHSRRGYVSSLQMLEYILAQWNWDEQNCSNYDPKMLVRNFLNGFDRKTKKSQNHSAISAPIRIGLGFYLVTKKVVQLYSPQHCTSNMKIIAVVYVKHILLSGLFLRTSSVVQNQTPLPLTRYAVPRRCF